MTRRAAFRAELAFSSCLVFAIVGHAAAQSAIPQKLALADAVRIAAERNPTFAAARDAVEAAEGDRLGAGQRLNPAFTVESVGRPLFQQAPIIDDHEYVFRVDQEIETGGRRRLRTTAAAAAVEVARARARDELRRLELDVRRAYFQVVLANVDSEVARASLDEIDRVIGLNRARFAQGEISGGEVRRLQVERLRFVDDAFAAELALRNARAALLAQMGIRDLGQVFDVVEPLAVPPGDVPGLPAAVSASASGQVSLDVARAQAVQDRPDLAATRHEIARADTETRLQRALRTPNVTVGGGYSHLGGLNTVAFGVTVPLPLFNRNQGGLARAEAERQQAENRAAATEIAVLLDVQQAANAVEIARQRVQYIEREYLSNARESRDIVQASYRLGAADLIDYLDAQRAFRDTARTYNRALYDLRVSQFQLEAAVGATPSIP